MKKLTLLSLAVSLAVTSNIALAKVSPADSAKLSKELTPVGQNVVPMLTVQFLRGMVVLKQLLQVILREIITQIHSQVIKSNILLPQLMWASTKSY